MTDPRDLDPTITDGPTRPAGLPEPGDPPALGDAYEPDEVSDTEIYLGELEASGAAVDHGTVRDPLLSLELRTDETDDPRVAVEEGIPYVPPVDPPTAGTEPDGDPRLAAGFGSSALDEPYDASHHGTYELAEGEVNARIRDALRADAATAGFADEIAISVVGERAILSGRVEDIEDADAAVAVAERASGIEEVVDRLEVASVEDGGRDPRGA